MSIIKDLLNDISSLTSSQIEKEVAKGLSKVKKTGLLDKEAEAKYEQKLRFDIEKRIADQRKKYQKDIYEHESKNAKTHEERVQALRKMHLDEMQTRREAVETRLERIAAEHMNKTERKQLEADERRAKRLEQQLERNAGIAAHNMETLGNMGKRALSAVGKGVNEYIGIYSRYFSDIETRMLGTGRGFDSVKRDLDKAIGSSPLVKQVEVLERIDQFLQRGVTRDVELRATLDVLSGRIAATFNALDPTLLSLTRVLQTDTTMARLGMESNLTQFLNREFRDTSYLAGDLNVQVSASLYEALSQMPVGMGAEMEYALQKWLGGATATGVSGSTVQRIAKGVGYLGSGDVSGLTSDTQLMNMLIAAANYGGVDLSSMLTGGLTADSINQLMQGLHSQASAIQKSGDNVVMSQYGQLFGLSLSDIRGFSNLDTSLMGGGMSYQAMERQTQEELSKIMSRTATSQMIDNVLTNTFSMLGEDIASNPLTHIMWRVADMATQSGGIRLPSIMALGSGLAQLPDVDQLMKMGLLMGGVVGSMGNILSTLQRGGKINLDALSKWDGVSSSTILSQDGGVLETAGATFFGDVSESAMYEGSMAQVGDIVKRTGQTEADEKAATSSDIDRLISAIETEGRKNRGEDSIIHTPNRWG